MLTGGTTEVAMEEPQLVANTVVDFLRDSDASDPGLVDDPPLTLSGLIAYCRRIRSARSFEEGI